MSAIKYILVYADEIHKLRFFNRFYPAIFELGYEIIYLTNRVSFSLFNRSEKKIIYVVRNRRNNSIHRDIPLTREIQDHTLTRQEATNLFSAVYAEAEIISKTYNIEYVFIWGGENTPDQAMKQFAHEHNIKTLFFELANIPGKIFIDPVGTNTKSSIYKNISLLNNYQTDNEKYVEWKKIYLKLKENEFTPPQSSKTKKIYSRYIIDHLGFNLLNIPFENNNSFYKKVKLKLWQKAPNIKYDQYKLENGNYLFFPMQVSNDSQLLFNSTKNNVQAIEYAFIVSKREGLELLVKPHPAEIDPEEYKNIFILKRKMGFKIINYPSISVLKYCEKVIAINSTVGLEAILMGKPVEFLGNTIYKNLDNEQLQNYIMSFLINIDFYGTENISKIKIKEVLNRLSS